MADQHRLQPDDENPSLFRWPEDRPNYTSFQAAVQGETARWNGIGMASAIHHGDRDEIAVTGCANINTGYPIVEDSLFLIGSISKIYTATLVMRLCEQGVLDLDTPVAKWIPDLRLSHDKAREEITLSHLLSHTAGFEGDRFTDYGRGEDALKRAVAEYHSLTQWYAPGNFYAYSNAGFYLVGLVIQQATGKSFEDVLTEELITPLALEHTEIIPERGLNHPFAVGHKVDRREGVSINPGNAVPRHINAAGGVMSSIGDLFRFAKMHLNDGELDGTRIISAESAQRMRAPLIEADTFYRSYGIGWSIYERPEYTSIGHGGAWGGHRANLLIIPEKDFILAGLTNSNFGSTAEGHVEEWALRRYLGIERHRHDAIRISDDAMRAFEGTYERHDGRFHVVSKGDHLRVTLVDIDEDTGKEEEIPRLFDLEPVADGRFRVSSPESRDSIVDFKRVPNADGDEHDLMRMWGRVAARAKSL